LIPVLTFAEALQAARATPAAGLTLFDGLRAIDCEALRGFWSGSGLATGHPLDGALEAFGWAGKRFDGDEEVQPLVFGTAARRFAVRPRLPAAALPLVLRWPALKRPPIAACVRALLPLLATRRSHARLRMVRHRGVLTAAMLYDEVPIIDVFRAVDADTVLGCMDRKGDRQPFFFVLRRAQA
jgi:hypothetical protein